MNMPKIIPIRDLRNTSEISEMCRESNEPIYITKNGYGDMVIMSLPLYEQKMFMQNVYDKLAEAEEDVAAGRAHDASESLDRIRKKIREKYDV